MSSTAYFTVNANTAIFDREPPHAKAVLEGVRDVIGDISLVIGGLTVQVKAEDARALHKSLGEVLEDFPVAVPTADGVLAVL